MSLTPREQRRIFGREFDPSAIHNKIIADPKVPDRRWRLTFVRAENDDELHLTRQDCPKPRRVTRAGVSLRVFKSMLANVRDTAFSGVIRHSPDDAEHIIVQIDYDLKDQ